jgi:glc operon protein GlcG
LQQKYVIDLEIAKRVAEAAQYEADKNGWDVVVAIADDGGHLMYLQRARAQLGSIEVAIEKARAAVMFKRPTQVFEEMIDSGRPAYLGLPGTLPLEGGEPLMYEGQLVGAIGVSGARASEDGIVARAGVAAMQ